MLSVSLIKHVLPLQIPTYLDDVVGNPLDLLKLVGIVYAPWCRLPLKADFNDSLDKATFPTLTYQEWNTGQKAHLDELCNQDDMFESHFIM